MNDNPLSPNAAQQNRKSDCIVKFFLSVLLLPLCLFSFSSFAQTQVQDVVELKDGSIYRGLIKEQDSGVVKIEISGGNLIVIPVANISSTHTEALKQFKDYTFHQKQFGYFSATTIGVSAGTRAEGTYYGGSDVVAGFSAQTVQGYRFYSHYMAGAGIGVDVVQHPMMQLYAHARYEPLKLQYTPYVFADLGYGFDLHGDDSSWSQKTTYSGGMIYGLGAGMRFNFNTVGAFTFDAEYKLMHRNEEVSYWASDSYVNKYSLRRIVFRIGLAF